jgi:hypothetical protein
MSSIRCPRNLALKHRENLEGVVAKHKHAPYTTSPAVWFKALNPDYTQKRGRNRADPFE